VNDGSTDKTASKLCLVDDIALINHQVNRGYGAALKTGLNRASAPWICILDADGTYPIQDIPRLAHELTEEVAMVVGARTGIGITINPFRAIARWTLRKMAHFLTGVMVPDLNSGMRIFHKSLYDKFNHLLPSGFSFTTTLTLASLYNGYVIKFIPIHYAARIGQSNIKPFKDFLAFTMLIVRIASYFDPLRFYLPIAFIFISAGGIKGMRDFLVLGQIGPLAASVFLAGMQMVITGILADTIVRRSPTPGPFTNAELRRRQISSLKS